MKTETKEFIKNLLNQIVSKLFCCHSWDQIKCINVEDEWGSTYRVFHYVCSKCGKYKKVKSH